MHEALDPDRHLPMRADLDLSMSETKDFILTPCNANATSRLQWLAVAILLV